MLFTTIEHSGTMATIKMMGWSENLHPLEYEASCPHGKILFAHLYTKHLLLIMDAAQRMPVITTARDEQDIRASWQRRGRDLSALDEQLLNYRSLMQLHPYVIKLGRRA